MRHHFGSKDELRKACDAHTLNALHSFADKSPTGEGLNDPATAGAARDALMPFRRYLARALTGGSEGAGQIFGELVTMTEQSLRVTDRQRSEPPVADPRARSAVMTAMVPGVPAFREHTSRSIGAGTYSPEGGRRIAPALLGIHSHPALTPHNAGTPRQGPDKPDG